MKKLAVVAIPVYQTDISSDEAESLIQAVKILKNYDFCLFCPQSLNVKKYEEIFNSHNKNFSVKRFKDKFFKSIRSYSAFCLESFFYQAFLDYEYMFLYQLDGWVFKDELKYWCDKGFDYIGAPLFEGFTEAAENSPVIEFSGNGGVSLRKISTFIKTLENEEKHAKTNKFKTLAAFVFKNFMTDFQKYKYNESEDLVITGYLRTKAGLRVAPFEDAKFFSFEAQPKRLYSLTGEVLPFACHAWQRFDRDFWTQHIVFSKQQSFCKKLSKPVLLLTFNRIDTLKKVFSQIRLAKPKRLYIASNGARKSVDGETDKVLEIRNYVLSNIDWDCEIKTRFLEEYLSCQKAVSEAISWFFEQEEDGIILEDDCIPTQSFFRYCENLLEYYKNDQRVCHIGGYNYLSELNFKESYYFSTIPHVWGWATWANRWKHFNFELTGFEEKLAKRVSENINFQTYWCMIFRALKSGMVNSWAYRWLFSLLFVRGLSIIPKCSLVQNIGEFGVQFEGKSNLLLVKTHEIGEICHPKKVRISKKLMNKMFEEWFMIDNRFFKSIVRSHIGKMRAIILFRSFILKFKN